MREKCVGKIQYKHATTEQLLIYFRDAEPIKYKEPELYYATKFNK